MDVVAQKMPKVGLAHKSSVDGMGPVANAGYIDTVSIKRWCDGAKKDASLGAVKRVIQLFRTACHYGDPAKNDDDSSMRIASDSAFQQILVFTLTEADGFFRKLLSLEEDSCAHLPASTFQTAKCVPDIHSLQPFSSLILVLLTIIDTIADCNLCI